MMRLPRPTAGGRTPASPGQRPTAPRSRTLVLPLLLGASLVLGAAGSRQQALELLEQRSAGVLKGSPHDFRYPGSLQGGGDQAPECAVCHRDPGVDLRAPLWDRSQSPAGASLDHSGALCLACHDQRLAPGFEPAGLCSAATPFGLESAGLGSVAAAFHAHPWPASGRDRAGNALTRPSSLRLAGHPDTGQGVDCLTCHNAHDNTNGNFLRMDPADGALCLQCHALDGWFQSAHGRPGQTGQRALETQACNTCHSLHGSPARPSLLRAEESTLCLSCHDGRSDCEDEVGTVHDLRPEFEKPFRHPVGFSGSRSARGDESGFIGWLGGVEDRSQVSCSDCHNPHAAQHGGGPFNGVAPALIGVRGVDPLGLERRPARSEAEICLKCHGANGELPVGSRAVDEDFSRFNASAHPVLEIGRSAHGVPSLRPEISPLEPLDCSACHGNNDPAGPRGPHGSEFPGLLKARWNSSPLATGAPDENGLCFTCHDPGVLTSGSWRWHSLHTTAGFSCAACHDPHGSREFPGLLNFRTNAFVEALDGELEVEAQALDQGTCTLRCHGHPHRKSPW